MKAFLKKGKGLDVVVLFVFLITVFWAFVNRFHFDLKAHIAFITQINSGEKHYPPHFLYFFLVNLFSGFSNNIHKMYMAATVVLSLSTVFKYIVSKLFLKRFLPEHRFKKSLIIYASLLLLFCFSLPDFYGFFTLSYMYLGKIPPTVWHNSTLITVFPFVILLFIKQLDFFEKKNYSFRDKDLWLIIVLIVLNITIKPSFLFVYFPATFLIIIRTFNLKNIKLSFIKLFPLIIGAIFLIIQFLLIYNRNLGSFSEGKSGVAIGEAFTYLKHYLPYWYIFLGSIISFIFPILTVICYKEILKFKPFIYATICNVIGFLIGMFVIEKGPRIYDGNFTWQSIACMYLLFLSILAFLLPKIFTEERFSFKLKTLSVVFVFHFVSGVLYLSKMFFTVNFS